MLTTEQKLLCALCHLGVFVGIPIVAPLVVLVVSNDLFVKQQAKEALAFQIGIIVAGFIGFLTLIFLIGFFIVLAAGIAGVVLPIVAVVKISDGIAYSYPVTGNFVRSNF